MTRRNEQGSVVVFVIVGVLLTAALVGAVFAVRHFQKSNGTHDSVPVTKTVDKAAESSNDKSSGAQSGAKSSSDQALKDALAAQSQAEKDKQARQNAAPANNGAPNTSDAANTTATNRLPETGPESTLMAVLGMSLLAGTAFAYVRSRRLI